MLLVRGIFGIFFVFLGEDKIFFFGYKMGGSISFIIFLGICFGFFRDLIIFFSWGFLK